MNVNSVSMSSVVTKNITTKPTPKQNSKGNAISFGQSIKQNAVRGLKNAGLVTVVAAFLNLGISGAKKLFRIERPLAEIEARYTRDIDSLNNVISVERAQYRVLDKQNTGLIDTANFYRNKAEKLTDKVAGLEKDTADYLKVIKLLNSEPLPIKYNFKKDKFTMDFPLDEIITKDGKKYYLEKTKGCEVVFTKDKKGNYYATISEIVRDRKTRKQVKGPDALALQVNMTVPIDNIIKDNPKLKAIVKKNVQTNVSFAKDSNTMNFWVDVKDSELEGATFFYRKKKIDPSTLTVEKIVVDSKK